MHMIRPSPHTLTATALALTLMATAPAARAEAFGSLQLTSDRIERGVSQSDRRPSLGGLLGWRQGDFSASLGAATVSDEQYLGSDGYQLQPELAWSRRFGGDSAGQVGLALSGQLFPGAHGPWFGSLPAAAQGRVQRARDSNYGTAEIAATLGWQWATLSLSRSLTDYLGLSATETGPAGTRVIQSTGTTYLALDAEWPLAQGWSLSAGVGRLHVPNFESLGYSDWRLGVAVQAFGLRWSAQASGSNASDANWRQRGRANGSGREGGAAGQAFNASIAWSF